MTWLDRAIGWVSPAVGFRRARLRYAMDSVKFAYEGAAVGRRTSGWITTGSSANASIGPALTLLRQRSRDLVENNQYAARAVRIIQTDTVGWGIDARPKSGDNSTDQKLAELWGRWTRECNADGKHPFSALQGLIIRTLVESGECLVRFRARRPDDGLEIPLQIQVLEPDYLDLSKTQTSSNSYILQGIQFNQWGKIEGYWLFAQHPGEVAIISKRLQSAFVPAVDVLHVYDILRPGQVRGVPWFAPVLLKLRDMAETDDADLMRMKIASCLAAFVTQPDEPDAQPLGAATTEDSKRLETFEPGMVRYMKPGAGVTLNTPAAASGFDAAHIQQLHGVAVGMNVMYEQLSGDLSRVNYSSFRGGMMVYRPFIEALRWNILIPLACDPIWVRFVETANAAGLIAVKQSDVEWIARQFQSVDPAKDAAARLMDLRTGAKTWPEMVSEQGFDPQRQLELIAEWNRLMDEAGIILDCDPRKVTGNGAFQAAVQPTEPETPKK